MMSERVSVFGLTHKTWLIRSCTGMEGMIADMENQIANMKASLKRNGKDKHQPKKEKEKRGHY